MILILIEEGLYVEMCGWIYPILLYIIIHPELEIDDTTQICCALFNFFGLTFHFADGSYHTEQNRQH
jgi:hypothetical protein